MGGDPSEAEYQTPVPKKEVSDVEPLPLIFPHLSASGQLPHRCCRRSYLRASSFRYVRVPAKPNAESGSG